MPVSRKKRNKKTNSFGIRKKERHQKALHENSGSRRDYQISQYNMMANMFAMRSRRKTLKGE